MKKKTKEIRETLIKAIQSIVINHNPTVFFRKLQSGSTLIKNPGKQTMGRKDLEFCSLSNGKALFAFEDQSVGQEYLIELGVFSGIQYLGTKQLKELYEEIGKSITEQVGGDA